MTGASDIRPQALFLAHRIPYPPDKGDKIRSWRILELLRERFEVHLCAFVDDPSDFVHEAFLAERTASLALIPLRRPVATVRSLSGFLHGAALSASFYRDARMAAAASRARRAGARVEVAFSSTMAPYLEDAPAGSVRIIDLCDADSAKWAAYGTTRHGPMGWVYRREARLVAKLEARAVALADRAFAICPEEAAVLAASAGVPVDWFGNGVDTDFFTPQDRSPPLAEVVFTGAMHYAPNEDAALWFLDFVWPRLREAHPALRFGVVGARPGARLLRRHGGDGVIVTGRVADIRSWLCAAHVAVAPMRIARGVQNKVLEAMAAGRPIVATAAAAEGLSIRAGVEYARADTPDAIAAEALQFLENADRRRAFGAAARRAAVERYSWTAQLAPLSEAISHLAPQVAHRLRP